jgi:hypothetical protein
VSRNETKRKQPADGQRSGAVAKRRQVKRSRTGRTQALNFEWPSQSAVFSRFRRNQRRSPVRKTAVCRRSNRAFADLSDETMRWLRQNQHPLDDEPDYWLSNSKNPTGCEYGKSDLGRQFQCWSNSSFHRFQCWFEWASNSHHSTSS